MPTRNGTDTFTARIALSDNRCLHLWRPLAPLARAREHLEPLRALAHRSITRDYHSSSALPHDQGAKTRLYASGAQGGVAAPLTTFALSVQAGRKVYAAEGARDAIAALTGAANRARALVATEHRDLFRRPLVPAELNRFGAVILDPPRAGAEEQVKQIAASTVPAIAYVSCNPASFARDARLLVAGGYRLDWAQPVGQFRWSTHVELAARFRR